MTLTELRYAVAVARERHFGRAAAACHVTQPTLSVGVRKLEDELGIQLFERQHSEIVITPGGIAIIEQARRVLEEADRISDLAEQSRDQLVGPLRIGAIYTAGPYLIPHLIPRLKRHTPQMPIIVEENYTSRLGDRLRDGNLDVIIVAEPFDLPGVVTWPLYHEPFMLLLPADHPWGKRKSIPARELADESVLLLGPGHCFRDQVLAACPDCDSAGEGNSLQRAVEGSSLETIRHMVATGLGITVVPVTSTGFEPSQRRLFTVRPFGGKQPPGRTMVLAWRRGFPRLDAIEALRTAIFASKLRGVQYFDNEPIVSE